MGNEEKVRLLLAGIREADREAMEKARARQAELAKPPGSLGMLEELGIRLAGMTGSERISVEKKRLLVFAADNGVTEEGVSSAPQSVTRDQTANLTLGKTGAATLARHFGCELQVCDVGVNAELPKGKIIDRKIAFGTKNIRKGPAMSREEACEAILTGAELTKKAAAAGVPVVIDGFISVTAALVAYRLEPKVRDYLIPSHASFEIGYRLAVEEMGLRPLFDLGMRLGEGSGCPIAFQILEAACAIQNEMATFSEAGIDDGYLDEIREGDKFTVERKT